MTNEQAERLVQAAERIAAALERHPKMRVSPPDNDDFEVMEEDDGHREEWGEPTYG